MQANHRCAAAVLALAVSVAGCAGPKTPEAVLDAARARLARGQSERAAAIVAKALAAPALADDRPALFRGWLALLVERGELAAAERELLARCAPPLDQTVVAAGYGVLADAYGAKPDWAALLALTGKLPRAALDPELRFRTGLDRLVAAMRADAPDAALDVLPELLATQDGTPLRQVVNGMADQWLRDGDHARLAELRVRLRAAGAAYPAWPALAAATEVAESVARQDWPAASDKLSVVLGAGDELAARGAVAGLMQALVAAREEGWVERIATQTLARAATTAVQIEAATRWLQQAQRLTQPAVLLDRLTYVAETDWPPEQRASIFREYMFGVLGPDDPVLAARALALSDRLAALPLSENALVALHAAQFDVAFVAQVYERCLALIDAGLPGRDQAWTEMARNKVQAHAALRDGNWEEAVTRFRAFMQFVDRTWVDAAPDPTTGLRHTRDMALGFNARRIGDILLQAGATNRAAEAFGEAMGYYASALTNVAPGSAEHRLVTNEIGRIPPLPM